MTERVTVTHADGVADVRLSRADKYNALDAAMFDALIETGEGLKQIDGLRAVVLSGDGKGFCAGLDFAAFMAMMGGGEDVVAQLLERFPDSPANRAQQVAYTWWQAPVPVIAALHGVVYGGGLQIALAADIRIVAPTVRMSVMEIKWGLVPDMTATQTLRYLVGLDVAKELTFTGREVNGEEAVRLGLATRVADAPHEAAMALAREIASKSPHAIRAGKKLFNAAVGLDVTAGLALEAQLQRELIGSRNQLEAVTANMQKRAPQFDDVVP